MKIRGMIEFIVMFILILLLYFAFILNIDYMTMSYHGKLEEYKNSYYRDSSEPNVLYEIREIIEYDNNIPKEVIQTIKNNKILKNILKEYRDLEEKQIENYIKKMNDAGLNKYIKEKSIVYIMGEDYELAFTLDMNNIIYQEIQELSKEINWNSKEITIENKYDIYKEATKGLNKLGVTEKFKFEPETIYFNYAIEGELDSDGYAIEDNKNQIKLVVRRPNYKIEKLQIGFTESLLDD